MTESRAGRKLKKTPPKFAVGEQKPNKKENVSATIDAPSSSFSTTLIWLPVLLAVGAYFYLNPAILIQILDEYIGFSEHYDGAPVALQPTHAYLSADVAKRDAVVKTFRDSWLAYERNAMGDDEYHPISQQGSNLTKAGGVGYMVVDVLDSLQIMGLQNEYSRARKWVEKDLSFDRDDEFSTFETTIRVLGGLLSAYHLSDGDALYLEKAVDLADRIMPAFDTPSGLPLPVINLARRRGHHTKDFPGLTSIAEVATLQLEFRYLSQVTGNDDYWRAAERVMDVVKKARLPHGLASIFMNIDEGQYITSAIRLGARGDSYYEYLLKQYIQTNASEQVYRDMYDDSIDAVHNYLIQKSMGHKMIYTSELVPEKDANDEISWRLTPRQDHLVCFFGGSLMLGATRTGSLSQSVSVPPRPDELSEKGKRDWKTGSELINTCMHTHDTATGLSPETVYFRVASDGMDALPNAPPDWYIKGAAVGEFPPYDARYMLRPETVESLFIAWRLTGDQLYRDHGWKIFQSIEEHCKVEGGGYATIINVDENPARQEDKMETFFLSETLKYLYLLFDDADTLSLDKHVFNTEAHPLPVFDPSIRTGFA
ncbi:glycoside hydrolase family 47 protein [Agrocybe pediades]|nr:glycoside hydrolase family 47 protein [Agrocybe pediades]